MASEAIFQPEAPEVPIQILGVLESGGLEFDHLWVMGLTDDAWPLPARPNPFMPVRLQRAAGIPQSDPVSRSISIAGSQGWLRAGPGGRGGHARMKDEGLAPSPLIIDREVRSNRWKSRRLPVRDAIPRHGLESSMITGPRLADKVLSSGGTRIFPGGVPVPGVRSRAPAWNPLETPRPGPIRATGARCALRPPTYGAIGTQAKLAEKEDELAALPETSADQCVTRCGYRHGAFSGRFGELGTSAP
jgi:hypothetical protein